MTHFSLLTPPHPLPALSPTALSPSTRGQVYKALNTFIDDLFAIVIKMPTLHRLSCFRDDLVFFVYLYQRWVYRVDYSRVNEFGQSGDDDAEVRVTRLDSGDSIEDVHVERIRALLGKLDRFSRANKAGGPTRDSPTGHSSSNATAGAGAGAGTGTPARRLSSQQRWGQLRAAAFMLGQQRLTEARERKFDDDLGALLGKLERSVSSSGAKQKKGAGARKRIK